MQDIWKLKFTVFKKKALVVKLLYKAFIVYKTLIKQGLNGHPGAKGEPGISKLNLEKTVRSIFKEMMKGFFSLKHF